MLGQNVTVTVPCSYEKSVKALWGFGVDRAEADQAMRWLVTRLLRLDRFAQPLQGHARKGQFNRIEVDDSGFMILQRAKQLEVQHGDLRTVQSLLRVETETSDVEIENEVDKDRTKHDSADRTKLIETLEREINHLQGEISSCVHVLRNLLL